MRGVLYQRYAPFGRERAQRVEIERGAGEMNRNDGFGPWRDGAADELGIRHQRIPLDIDKYGAGARKNNEIDR